MKIFEVENAGYAYPGGGTALKSISFTVEKGESIALLGANASGKSTLLHLLDGLYFPDSGSVTAFGTVLTEESVETHPFARKFRSEVGFLFQNSDAQLFCPTVEEELAFGPLQLRIPPDEVEKRVEDTLDLLEIGNIRNRPPHSLSGGEKKKVALAGLITCGPSVILLDEPSAGLDPRSQQWLIEFLHELTRAGITLIAASHDLSFAAEVTDRALVLSEQHELVCDTHTVEALDDLDMLFAANLIHAHTHRHGSKIHAHPHLHDIRHEHPHAKK